MRNRKIKAFYLTGRRFLGIRFYRLKRHIQLRFGGIIFARNKSDTPLPYQAAAHHSLLLRQLKNVDMWMQHNKVKNLKIAIPRLNGIVLRPGETFSYWDLIGKPTRRKGYLAGMHLVRGTVRSGIGGGLCQLSNLIYWMTLHTSLTVTERHRHSYDVFPDSGRTLPFGSGATCYYNYIDLQIKNETEHTFQLQLRLTDTHLVGEWRQSSPVIHTYRVYEVRHWISHEYGTGYIRHNEISRITLNPEGEQVSDELVTVNRAVMMYEPLLSEARA